jgi:DNA-binding FadR family transcriptional regulator
MPHVESGWERNHGPVDAVYFGRDEKSNDKGNFHQYIQQNESALQAIDKQQEQIYESIKTGDSQKVNQAMMERLNYVEELLQVSILGPSSKV